MLSWIGRIMLNVAGIIVSWLIGRNAPYFVTAEIAAILILFMLLAFWPADWRKNIPCLSG